MNVVDGSAPCAHQVMVIAHIGIETTGSSTYIEDLDLSQLSEIVEHRVHSFQRDAGHVSGRADVHGLGGGVGFVALQNADHQLTLWRHLAPGGTKCGIEFN